MRYYSPFIVLDPLLRSFVDAADEANAERELSALIEQHALPLAKAIVGRKLRSYSDDRHRRTSPHDREDVVADAMVTLIERLRAEREGDVHAPIENFVNYAAVVVHSTCAHHIRRRYPERARLKNRLRYIFSSEPRLATWATSDDDLACGPAAWSGRTIDANAEPKMRAAVERSSERWAAMNRTELSAAVVSLVRTFDGPVSFEELVRAVASASVIIEPNETSDPDLLATREPAPESLLDQRRFLERVWDEVSVLPGRQRAALLLNLRDANGAGLLWLLPIAGVATVRQIARLLEIDDAEFAALWRLLPLDDLTIGQRLGCTRQQVINLRMAARKRLVNRAASRDARPGEWKANLAVVSASLKR